MKIVLYVAEENVLNSNVTFLFLFSIYAECFITSSVIKICSISYLQNMFYQRDKILNFLFAELSEC